MLKTLIKILSFVCCITLTCTMSFAQVCFPHKPDTTINLNCRINCTDLSFTIPDLRKTSDYMVLDIPYQPFPFTSAAEPAIDFRSNGGWPGNSFSKVQPLPFKFCFFDSVYEKLAVGANGYITFDESMAGQWCDPRLVWMGRKIFLPSTIYAPAMIASVLQDLDPLDTAHVSPNTKVEFRIEGRSPCRRAIISYFEVPLWPWNGNCQGTSVNTHQIVLYENSGIIDIFIRDNVPCIASNQGLTTIGIQNFAMNIAITPRNKNCTIWGSSFPLNKGYRFLPSGGGSVLVSTGLYLNGNTLVKTGTLQPAGLGELDVQFNNICPVSQSEFYVFRAVYSSCSGNGSFELADTVHINKTTRLNATASASPALCNSSTGFITVSVPQGIGVPPFQYSINGNAPQPGNVFTGLASGVYTVLVEDAGNCTSSLSVTVPRINDLVVILEVQNTSCNKSTDGSIKVIAARGLPPYRYSINGNIPQSSDIFSNLSPGIYMISVSDVAGCSWSSQTEVVAGPSLKSTFTKRDVSCFGNSDGLIILDPPLAGTPPFQYSLDGINYQTGNVFNGLAAGNYSIYIKDNSTCGGIMQITILSPPELKISATVHATHCFGENNGMISILASGGMAPYFFSLDGFNYQTSNSFNVAAGNYTIYVTDRNRCMSSTMITVVQPAVFMIAATTSNASCIGNDGKIIVSATGGNSVYQYSIDGITFQSSTIFNVSDGNYTVTAKDNLGCSATQSAVVGLTNNLILTPSNDEIICEGTSVQLKTVTNATQFTWTPANSLNNASISNPSASPATNTQYIVAAVLGNCRINDTIMVTVNLAPIADAGKDGDICYGQSYSLQASGGEQFLWSPSSFLTNTTISDPITTPERTIQYSLTVTDANQCRSLVPDVVTVVVTPPVIVTINPSDTVVSMGDQIQLQANSAGINYTWTPSMGLSDASIANPVATVTSQVSYKVETITAAGCRGEASVDIKVYKGPDLYVATAFTPNGDGKNETFTPFPVGIKKLNYFMVYNRWGQLVFSTKKLNEGWDGKAGMYEQAPGVYVWMAQGITKDGLLITKKGTVTLIR